MKLKSDLQKIDSLRWNDPSLWGIVFSNGLSIFMAVFQGWSLHETMWIYWGQSVIIGITNVFRMLSLKDFTTEGLTMNGDPVPETPPSKFYVASFFALHYGFFHFVYAIFLWQEMPLTLLSADHSIFMMVCVASFVAAHSYSLMHNFAGDFKHRKPNLGTLMFYPYLRIIPMHLTIITGDFLWGRGIVLFMLLKTLADVGMHMVERHLFRRLPGEISSRIKN